MKVFFAVLSIVLLFGMIGDKEKDSRRNYTIGFVTTVVAIVIMCLIG